VPALTVGVIAAQAIPLLAHEKVRASQDAAARGDGAEALKDALAARRLQPWASSPHLQLALVEEEAGDLAKARAAIADAIERDRSDWRLQLVAARLEVKTGNRQAARERLREAQRLNPRSRLFAK
jgi:Tfp pilus assembly protein PilF